MQVKEYYVVLQVYVIINNFKMLKTNNFKMLKTNNFKMLKLFKYFFFPKPLLLGRWKIKNSEKALNSLNPDPGYF